MSDSYAIRHYIYLFIIWNRFTLSGIGSIMQRAIIALWLRSIIYLISIYVLFGSAILSGRTFTPILIHAFIAAHHRAAIICLLYSKRTRFQIPRLYCVWIALRFICHQLQFIYLPSVTIKIVNILLTQITQFRYCYCDN